MAELMALISTFSVSTIGYVLYHYFRNPLKYIFGMQEKTTNYLPYINDYKTSTG